MQPITAIHNAPPPGKAAGDFVLLVLGMLYAVGMLGNALLTYLYIGFDHFFVMGATLTAPFIFVLDAIVAEVYGYRYARVTIIAAFAVQTLAVLKFQGILQLPFPGTLTEHQAYVQVLGPSLLRTDVNSFVSYISANVLYAYALTRWKVLLKGRYFYWRCLGASAIAAVVYSVIFIVMATAQETAWSNVLQIVITSCLTKIAYMAVLAAPVQWLVAYLKKLTGIDVYELPRGYLPKRSISGRRDGS